MERRFAGKVALVTGATTGIGQATAVRLAADGALVAVNQKPGIDAGETLRKVKEAGGEAFPVVADMRDPKAVTAMVKEVARQGGRLDYVVSNAAINPFMTWDATSIEEFDNLFETNVRGAWVVCTEGARQMIAEGHGGAIVLISSISAHVGAPTQVAYCGTKGAISILAPSVVLGLVLYVMRARDLASSGPSSSWFVNLRYALSVTWEETGGDLGPESGPSRVGQLLPDRERIGQVQPDGSLRTLAARKADGEARRPAEDEARWETVPST